MPENDIDEGRSGRDAYKEDRRHSSQDDNMSPGEAGRQIGALWNSYHRLADKVDDNTREIMAVSVQVPYMVSLLERIDKHQIVQTPVCADRGARVVAIEEKVKDHDKFGDRIMVLEASSRVLKWAVGVVTAVIVIVGADTLMKVIGS